MRDHHDLSSAGPGSADEDFRSSAPPADDSLYPWDADPTPDDPDALSAEASGEAGPRQRHAFNEARKTEYLKALAKTGGIKDACRKIGISPRTIYRHQQDDPDFFENCRVALRMCGTPVELTVWSRAVEGVEQEFVVGGEVRVRRRYDAGLLHLLLQGSNPKKYGPRPGFKRKRILKYERKQMEREIHAEIAARRMTFEESIEKLERQLQALGDREEPKQIAAGWTRIELPGYPRGYMVPPGFAPIPGWQPTAPFYPGEAGAGGEVSGESDPPDSM